MGMAIAAPTILRGPSTRTDPRTREFVRDSTGLGHYRPGRERLLLRNKREPSRWRQKGLDWLVRNVHPNAKRAYYTAVLGHDLHLSTWAELYVQHYHATEVDPFTGQMGWLEDVGLVSKGLVTTAFRDFEIDQLIAESSLYGDFKYHEVGTSTAAEANTQTALTTTTGIARATGTQVEQAANIYRSVATVTADTTETWGEHGIFNNTTGATMLDRSLISPTVAVVNLDQVTFTYDLTKAAE
jgi:hypothetical protein